MSFRGPRLLRAYGRAGESGPLWSCVQADPARQRLGIRSRLGALMVLEDCIIYMDKDDSMRRAMVSLAEKLCDVSDAEFPGAALLNGC